MDRGMIESAVDCAIAEYLAEIVNPGPTREYFREIIMEYLRQNIVSQTIEGMERLPTADVMDVAKLVTHVAFVAFHTGHRYGMDEGYTMSLENLKGTLL